jgi:transketolase
VRVEALADADAVTRAAIAYRDSVLPPSLRARVAIEQASRFDWERHAGRSDHVIGTRTFGASAPLKDLQTRFAFEPERVAAAAKRLLGQP